jgi:hypothetical protein
LAGGALLGIGVDDDVIPDSVTLLYVQTSRKVQMNAPYGLFTGDSICLIVSGLAMFASHEAVEP